MFFSVFLLIFGFLFFLFFIYILSRDDHVFLRKGVALEHIFNGAFLGFLISVFSARLFYVLIYPENELLNPLNFLLFPYYPGMSLIGGVIGGVAFIFLYYSQRKMPAHRIFDFFAFAFIAVLSWSYLINKISFFLIKKNTAEFLTPVVFFIIFIFVWKALFPGQRRGDIKEGSLGFAILAIFSAGAMMVDLLSKSKKIFLIFSIEDFIFLSVIIVSLYFLNKQEKILQKFRGLKK